MADIRIPDYYKGKTILVTGVTGFIGKILVEKLLRSCPEVEKIYVLIRKKKSIPIEKRWNEITDLPLFNRLKIIDSSLLKKVEPIEGTIDVKDLALSETVKNEVINTVDIIFHSAAAVQFSEDLIFSLRNNTLGTYNVAEFARSLMKLKCFVYVSTAYSNCDKQNVAEEKIYKSAYDWKTLIEILNVDPYPLSILRDKIKGSHPSTYTFTKALAEDVMDHFSQYYPVMLTRPSVVLSTVDDPIPGWVDSLNGVSAMFLSVALGVVRVINGVPTSCLDYISADHAVKALIIAGWKLGKQEKRNGIEVMSVNYGKDIKMPTSWFFEQQKQLTENFPSVKSAWYPFVIMVSNPLLFWILFLLLQVIPAYMVDFCLMLLGRPPILVNLTIRYVQAARGPLKSFFHKQYAFPNNNFNILNDLLYEPDKKEFLINSNKYSIKDYVYINGNGIFKYYLKEPEMSVRKAHFERLRKIHYTTITIFSLIGLLVLYRTINYLIQNCTIPLSDLF
ncbi:fatty acyl-CoA reductase 1-like [Cimex lectularius]|uniref:Fatty acyl-CoA reductase n=1 Tax=Cimex lectularius TaxID=79782 RepID=A0A8I6S573_CIMLE|nr:fatty acyl-CoA reductase 1-like [Cimex lectularius]XP_014256018.1 fatty acyl-CoA reductase 1-like [Cimex lectularius]